MSKAAYYREAVEYAFEGAGLWDAIKDIPAEKRDEIGESLATSAECESQAFYTPEHPAIAEVSRLKRRLKWQQELEHCRPCNGTGRLRYNAGPWAVDTQCESCGGAGTSPQ
jgi:hypothetical protein